MAEVKVLKAGYARWVTPGQLYADGTITLVKGQHNVLVDTGLPLDRQTIVERLRAEHLEPGDVDFVVCTHGHSDHVGNNSLFPNATFVVSHDVCRGDLYTLHDFSSPYVIDEEVQVISTPGHSSQDVSVIVRTDAGIVAIVGDLFESEADLHADQPGGAFSERPEMQRESQERILRLADFVVPGHGDAFPASGRGERP